MANSRHLAILQEGLNNWNRWRTEPPESSAELNPEDVLDSEFLNEAAIGNPYLTRADLSGADLTEAMLRGGNFRRAHLQSAILRDVDLARADLSGADLSHADLRSTELWDANLIDADLTSADLREASLTGANLNCADLRGADLRQADMSFADLRQANLSGAKLNGANLQNARLVDADLTGANLDECRVYGISAWNLKVDEETKQSNLIITRPYEAKVTVGDIEIAQFIYLLLNRKKIRNALHTITSKAVLLLGRFSEERKEILEALADELRKYNLVPIIFDFERSTDRDFTETIKILAGLSLFVIVDITKPRSVSQELTAVVPDYQIPFVPILNEDEEAYSMFADFKKYDWVLKPILTYRTKELLTTNFRTLILDRAWEKHLELQRIKNEKFERMSVEKMLEKQQGIS